MVSVDVKHQVYLYKKESAQKVDPGEENSPASPAGTRTRDLSVDHESVALPLSYSRSPEIYLINHWREILVVLFG